MVYKPSVGREFYDDEYSDEEDQVLNNRIVYPTDKMYGREKEIQVLSDLFDQLYVNNNQDDETKLSPVAVIQASAGTGKSAMVRNFIERQEKKPKSLKNYTTVFHIQGRFERSCTDPFSAILESLDDFFDRLLKSKDKKTSSNLIRISSAINEFLEAESSSLTTLVPNLVEVLKIGHDAKVKSEVPADSQNGCTQSKASSKNSTLAMKTGMKGPNTWNRIRYLFNALFCAICTKDYPLIMFLDDCQWADDESLALIESLIQDPGCRYFMFIGNATRGITVAKEKESNFAKLMKNIEGPYRKVTRINLLNLSIDEIGEFIADTLELEVVECRPLIEIVYGKTRGNVFFSMQALEELKRRNVLYFSMVLFRWEWNLDGVEFQNALSDLSDDVGEYVSSKIQSLPRKLRRALVIASHTKATFDVGTLQALMNEDGIDIDFKELNGLLDIAVLVGLLSNTIGTGMYRFAHDRIQQAAYWMVPSGQERGKLRIMIGRKLYELYFQPEGKEWMLFAAADHLNSSIGHGGKDDLSLAKLNLLCGKKARFLAAFVPASMYLRLALNYLHKLDENPWKSHYELSFQIYQEISDSELCLGNFKPGNEFAQIVLKETQNLDDKLSTFLSLAEAKGKQQQHAESLRICQDALVRVGAIPKRMHYFHMKKDINVIKRFFKKYSDNEILLLPVCQDKNNEMVMDLLSQASRRANLCRNKTEFQFCIGRKLRLTFKFGFTRGSAHAFASYGQLLQDHGNDIESALRMARLARQILSKTDPTYNPMKPQTLFVVGYWIEAWSCPREHVMETLQEAHIAGMARGHIEIGFQCIVICNIFAQSAGYPLGPIERAGAELIEQLRLYNINSVLTYLMASRLSVLCLMGKKKIDWEELEPSVDEQAAEDDLYTRIFSLISRLELGVLFGNVEFAVKMSELIDSIHDFGRSYTCCSKENFYSALAYVELARKTGMSKHKAKATEYLKTLKNLCRTRGENVSHKCLIMEAETLSLECRDKQKLTNAYDKAIYEAVKMGYSQDAALGSELAGASMAGLDEQERADEYLNQACNLWQEYGAIAKVRHISKYSNLEPEQNSSLSISFGPHTFSAIDMALSRQSLKLDLLSGIHMKSEIKMEASGATLHESLHESKKEKNNSKVVVPLPSISDLSATNECKSLSASTSGR
eukprot:CAMPEP_0197185754 /NCGR_PEP_ID=MMETSP1423-20130617/12625_1 /TAXON_ID=476441 /ORGANISM="Pseudo-nitzschia heimii, Strain UNC1101" /LENGTH=1162 /DNA_ID=CAMNT_0042636903 /DNA_START=94 /DNA_END=3579 /DNA_ORIENTATION=-